MKYFSSLWVLLFCFALGPIAATPINGEEPIYCEAVAKNGDGVYSLLRKYSLIGSACNRSEFYRINGLAENAALKKGKAYKLPVQKYKYNGKSIRSTIGIEDFDQAVKIKKYNEALVTSKIQNESYMVSKDLWVPFHLLHCDQVEAPQTKPVAEVVTNEKSKELEPIKEEIKPAPETTKIISKDKAVKYVMEPIFGSKHETVAIKDFSLKNKVYYLVSGHGGPDPGARCTSCPNILCEDEYAYDVVLRLAKNLIERGATVHVIIQDKNDGIRSENYLKCDKDEKSMGKYQLPLSQLRRLEQRSKKHQRITQEI